MRIPSLLFCLLMIYGCCSPARADAPSATDRFASLQGLAGTTWRIAKPANAREEALRISYRAISAGTALVETFGNPARGVTETIYHMDNDRLIATHYCAQGNQPRLKLRESQDRRVLVFDFFDATNLPDRRRSHLVRMQFDLIDAKRLRKLEVYETNEKEEATTFELVRIDDAD